jgi:hypothetical protein
MKGADFPNVTAPLSPVAGNGRHRTASKNGHAPKPPADTAGASQPLDAAFVTIEAEPIDAPMWSVHPALWLQPEAAPAVPVWTSLAPERHNRIPAPAFLQIDTAPPDRPAAPDTPQDPLRRGNSPKLPLSGLALLGWDPRAVCRKEGEQ